MFYCQTRSVIHWAVLVMAVMAIRPGRASGADYTVHVVDPVITDHMILQDGSLPKVCRQTDTIRIWGCRGEYEPASFVVSAASKPLKGVLIDVGPVVGPGGQWTEDAVDVRVVKTFKRSPILLVHDDSFLGSEPDPTPKDPQRTKPVARKELRDSAELQPLTIEKRRQFWITVHIPEHARPGTYRTTLKIVPRNGVASELQLIAEVYPFELAEAMLEYSIYYPVYLARPRKAPLDSPESFCDLTEEQYLAELKNMLAHGLSNPNIDEGPRLRSDGSINFSVVDRILDLRESVGMRPKALYLIGHPLPFKERPLTREEREKTRRYVRQINEWARRRGYDEVFYSANDEWWGEQLSAERDSMEAVREAGGKVFVAVMHTQFFDRVGDVLDRPILQSTVQFHLNRTVQEYREKFGEEEARRLTAEISGAGSFERMIAHPEFRKAIDGAHRQGKKIYTYMNPTAGTPLPQLQRRAEGLGLWRVGFDGTMNWAYTHVTSDKVDQAMHFAKVYRTADGVLDTTYWEGFREGVDDVRYLTTLYEVLREVAGRFPQEPLIGQTHAWLATIDVANGDLDTIRREMAQRIIALQDLGYKVLSSAEILEGIEVEQVKVMSLPEPWRFKIDPGNDGVKHRLFDPSIDDNQWDEIRTDKNRGWETQGFAGKQSVGYGWYRTRLPLTEKDLARKFKYLYFEAVDEDAWVYLNGQEIFEHSVTSTGLLREEIWLEPFTVSLAGLDLSGGDLLAVRVHNGGDMGGIWKPVHLILSDQELTTQKLHEVLKRRKGSDQ